MNNTMGKFYWLWFGQLISIVASGVTNFALGIWILRQSGGVMDYASLMVAVSLPGIMLTPFIGALIDRYSRKQVIILADLSAACTTLVIAVLYFFDTLATWHIYVAAVIDSVAIAFHLPALTALVTQLVKKEQLAKAAGMNELSAALAVIAGPFLAGLFIQSIGIAGILLLDMFSFVVAASILVAIRLPERLAMRSTGVTSLLDEARSGWRYIAARQGFTRLLVFGAMVNAVGGMVVALMMPMALELGDETQAGFILASGGVGSLFGAILLAVTGGPERKIYGLIGGVGIAGVCLLALGLQGGALGTAICLCLFNACIPIAFGSELVIWQRKVASQLQGRVFAVYTAVSSITLPLGSVAAGYFADTLQASNALAWLQQSKAGQWLAVDLWLYSEIRVMFIGMAVLVIGVAAWGRRQSVMWCIEEQLPDADQPVSERDSSSISNPAAVSSLSV